MSSEGISASSMVDTERYPITDLGSPVGSVLAQTCQEKFTKSGLCILPGFIRPDAVDQLAREANSMLGQAYFCDNTHNAYLTEADPNLSPKDVTQRQESTFVGSVAYDLLADHGAL